MTRIENIADREKPIPTHELMHTGFRALAQRLDRIEKLLEKIADDLARQAES